MTPVTSGLVFATPEVSPSPASVSDEIAADFCSTSSGEKGAFSIEPGEDGEGVGTAATLPGPDDRAAGARSTGESRASLDITALSRSASEGLGFGGSTGFAGGSAGFA